MPEITQNGLKQRDTEAYFRALRKYYEKGMTDNEVFGASVRAGVEAGLISDLTADGVGDLAPALVEKLGSELADLVNSAREQLPS